ncbi:MAG: hypothetical protein EBX50_22055, partial [Chitinophagia bacterium]|nr:hypothetical protein [Chitinophagia bacterium]
MPLTTNILLYKANKILHFSVELISQLSQQLYEKGYITYIRTETPLFSYDFLQKIKQYFIEKEKVGKRTQKYEFTKDEEKIMMTETLKGTHEAIRPTNIYTEKIDETDAKLNALYQWIHKYTLMTCMPNCIIETQKIYATPIQSKTNDEYFFANISRIQKKGWKKVDFKMEEEIDNHTPYEEYANIISYVMSFSNNKLNNVIGIFCDELELKIQKIYTKTDLSQIKYFTEGTLIKKLDEKGIGRPSTFSNILQSLFKKKYIELKKNDPIITKEFHWNNITNDIEILDKQHQSKKVDYLTITQLGKFVCHFLENNFSDFFEYDYTKKMELDLDEIQFTDKIWYQPCADCYLLLQKKKEELKKNKIRKIKFPIKDEDGNYNYELLITNFGLTVRKKNTEHYFS